LTARRLLPWRRASAWAAAAIALAVPFVHGEAVAAFGAHYLGHNRQGAEFRVYLDGGEFLGRQGDFHAIRVTVHGLRGGRLRHVVEGCVYRFDASRRERDTLECGPSAAGPWAGARYGRPGDARGRAGTDALQTLVCVRRCGPGIPQRLQIEGADEDNG